MTLRHLILSFSLAIFAISAVAEDTWFARPWRTDDGLPDNSISGIVQSPDGFLWIGTPSGLARFDGAQFDEFSLTNIPALPSRAVRALALDHLGRLWLGTDRGCIVCVENNHAQVFTPADGLPDAIPKKIVEDGDGAIWISYATMRSNIAQIKDGRATNFASSEGLPRPGSLSITTDNRGQLWFTRGGDIGFFHDGRFQVVRSIKENSLSIAAARTGGLWICSYSRLFRLTGTNRLQEIARLPKPDSGGGPLFESSDGSLWIASSRAYGLLHWQIPNENSSSENSIRASASAFELVPTTHPVITCLSEDNEGNVWAGTAGGGLDRLRPKVLDLINPGKQPFESILSICQDTDGYVWAVNRDGDLTRVKNGIRETVSGAPNWPGGLASCVAADQRGGVWIGTHNDGLYRFTENQFTNLHHAGAVRAILVAANGNVWVGGPSARLECWHDGKSKILALPPNARFIRAMAEDSRSNIWVATSEGLLLRVDGDELVNETTNWLRQPISIRCLCATDDGSLWIGYADGGLGRVKNGKYARLTVEQGLDDNYISQIVADDRGWLWMCGSHGFFRVRQQQLNEAADAMISINPTRNAMRIPHLRSVTFGRGEGMSGLQANYDNFPAAFHGNDGRLWIATHTGVAVINPARIRDNLTPPPVFVERATLDGRTLAQYDARSPLRPADARNAPDLMDPSSELRLPPNYHRLEINFTALSFTAPENVQFRYQLEGFDENWVEAGAERSAIYPRLPPGNYHFHVVACNNSIVWSPKGAALNFVVEPFFWQTWWFETVVLTVFALAIGALVRYVSFRRLRFKLQLLEQQAALDKERARIARDLHDDLGGSLTQVGLLLEMAQRHRNGDGSGSGSEMQKCSSMVRNVANSVDEIIWAINPRNDTAPYLVDYISQFVVEFLHAANIQCRVDLPNDVPKKNVSPEARHNLFLVVKESLNNIARHAQASEVRFRAVADAEKLSIAIEDNGHGFSHAPDGPTADGLRNMKQRMTEIGGQFRIESKSETGTRVSILYPWPEK